MKRTTVLVVMCIFLMSALFADDMTVAQAKVYNSQALVVMRDLNKDLNSGWWTAYQGARKISKSEFFRLAGYPDYEKICIEQEKKEKRIHATGITISTITGVGLIAYTTYMLMENKSLSNPSLVKQIQLITGSLGAGVLAGIVMSCYSVPSSNISASFAIGVADIYNQELKTSVMLSY